MKCLLMLVFIAAFSATGKALKCYQCEITNPSCNDPMDNSATGVREISNPAGECYCVKTVLERGNKKGTIRDCISLSKLNITDGTDARSVKISITVCNSDFCNGASCITSTQMTLMVLAVLSIVMIFQ